MKLGIVIDRTVDVLVRNHPIGSFLSAFRFARSFLACAGLGNGSLSAATSSGVSGGKTVVVIQGAAVSPGEADEHDVGVPVF